MIGQVPYGARLADAASGTVLIDDPEAVVRMMYRRLVDEQHSLAAIAQELTEQTWASITRAVHRVRPRRAAARISPSGCSQHDSTRATRRACACYDVSASTGEGVSAPSAHLLQSLSEGGSRRKVRTYARSRLQARMRRIALVIPAAR